MTNTLKTFADGSYAKTRDAAYFVAARTVAFHAYQASGLSAKAANAAPAVATTMQPAA